MTNATTHQPKGSMCTNCGKGGEHCKALPFSTMPVIKTYPDGVKAVKCSNHAPTPAIETVYCIACGGRHKRLPDGTVLNSCGH